MKAWLVAVAAVVGLACTQSGLVDPATAEHLAEAEQGLSSFKSTMNGVSVYAAESTEVSGFVVEAWEAKTSGAHTTYLSFSRWAYDLDSRVCSVQICEPPPKEGGEPVQCEVCSYTRTVQQMGAGNLPNDSLRAAGSVATLTVDISALADFSFQQCLFDESTGSVDCSTAPTLGNIALTFKKDGKGSTFTSGVELERVGHYTSQKVGTFRTDTAAVSGSFLGVAPAPTGTIGSGANVTRQVSLAR